MSACEVNDKPISYEPFRGNISAINHKLGGEDKQRRGQEEHSVS